MTPDGAIEHLDSLYIAPPGTAHTGFNVLRHSFDLAQAHPAVAAAQLGHALLGQTCHECPVHSVCGAGNYAHRYRRDTDFANPSVYCADLLSLIEYIAARVAADLQLSTHIGADQPNVRWTRSLFEPTNQPQLALAY